MERFWCGPSYLDNSAFGRFIKRRLSYRQNQVCELHDINYRQMWTSRQKVDQFFLESLLISSSKAPAPLRYWYFIEDYTFFFFVRLFGSSRWGKD
jgi:hypothetical protein